MLGEFLRFIQRRALAALDRASEQLSLYRAAFLVPPITEGILSAAAEVSRAHGLQLWDAVVCMASRATGA